MTADSVPECIPVRMLNEFTYCPRLFYLEYVQQEWRDNLETEEGRSAHRRVDEEKGDVGDADGDEPFEARSVWMSAPDVGLTARLDLIERDGGPVVPVDYKRGHPPDLPERAWPPERVQLCAQGLILRENGYECDEGVLYFVGARQRVTVPFDDDLVALTRQRLEALRETAAEEEIPPPLVNSPKCPRCSLVGICLPDEVNHLQPEDAETTETTSDQKPRKLIPSKDLALPLYVGEQGARVGFRQNRLVVRKDGETLHSSRLLDVSQVGLFGNVQISTQCVRKLCWKDIPVLYFSYGNRFCGWTHGMSHKNVELRMAQYTAAADDAWCLELAKRLVRTKILNCRTLLRRNHLDAPKEDLRRLKQQARRVEKADDLQELLGMEGRAGRLYYQNFAGMLKAPHETPFDFDGRNRRPPRDPVNALLSLVYALLTKEWAATLLSVGFDPLLGFYHQPRYGRPALALDMMEEFRPIVADSVVLSVINQGEVKPTDFIHRGKGTSLTRSGRRTVLRAYERRLDELVTHPVFGYRISYRRVLEVQARLLGRFLSREIPDYPAFRTR